MSESEVDKQSHKQTLEVTMLHTVTVTSFTFVESRTYTFELLSTAKTFAWNCALEARKNGADIRLDVVLKNGDSYAWEQNTGWFEAVTPDHKCVMRETPDGYACAECLYS